MSTDLLTEDDFWDDIHCEHEVGDRLTTEDIRLSVDVPVVISYRLVDLGVTRYHFGQPFTKRDTLEYFRQMSNISSGSINDLVNESPHAMHFYRSRITAKMKKLLQALNPGCSPDDSTIIYHFALYTDRDGASREAGRRSPRVYFMLGRNGVIFPLFFDPYHEINP